MPPSTTPTLRQQRLGAELRKLREHSGLTSTAAAQLLGLKQGQLSSIEAGRYAVSADRVRTLARTYSCADPALVEALAAMTGGRTRGWWDDYREYLPVGLIDLAELEHHATALRVALALHIPALLQTADHARAMLREAVPPFRPYELEHRLSYRIKRQEVLHRSNALPYTALLHEAALRMQYGGPEVASAQLAHLLDLIDQDNITIRVIPFTSPHFPGNGQSFDYAAGPVPQLDTVQLDTHHGGCEFLDAEAQLVKYRTVLDRMESCALETSESRKIIENMMQKL
ncbi:helix-turn-helix transcriptional regulator [Streptomyces sp. NL15-2K]|uniref:helix-turn-helix domain-containing protein n=1 Tax=Streptomyces sp. NL15-2K TaxID=376149 RepID=UPI000F57A988|nr:MULTISPECIES: helix-turn-helix transcriptional regulator [Actinomycetes]WKX13079.1 helix-turn-helix transcriptional regulator [Kutzneria buriramensis]GCB45594.1 Cys-tRNA(Pro) deacylase ybaK [Streptomyces sp. NL15-2K]